MELRKVGAAAREMLLEAAAKKWNVPVDTCMADGGRIIHKTSKKSADYGSLVEIASKLDVPKDPKLKDPKDFKILGKSEKRPDIPLKVTGQAVFGIDVEVPGMVYASVERCPIFGGKLSKYDDHEALKVKGVLQVVRADRTFAGKFHYDGVAVVADNYWAAFKGRKALRVEWDGQDKAQFSSVAYEAHMRELAKSEGLVAGKHGDYDKAMAEAPVQIEAFYETPMVSYLTMEPMNCVAQWKPGDEIEVWASTQGSTIIKDELSGYFKVPKDKITVHVMFAGGGFGRRLAHDFAIEAANISKAIGGKPVKVIWPREDDIQMGPFRPLTFSAMKAGLSKDGKPLAFQHKVIAPPIDHEMDHSKEDPSMTEGINEQKYEIPNMKNLFVFADVHLPLWYWRSVTSSTLAFSHECFIDEMAVKAGKDPMAFRLDMLTQPSDVKRVMTKLKEVSGWDKPLPPGWGRGVAQWEFFAGLCGQVVEVSRQPEGGIKVEKVYAVIDLGSVVNPDMVAAQVEGGIIMALGAATKDAVTFENGRVQQSNFHDNRVPRISEVPKIEVHILAEGGKIKGVGEPGLPPFAPALCNAVFAATGKRIRKLPFDPTSI
jgi:isoquinoline 1-oxidoreductase beta subunit